MRSFTSRFIPLGAVLLALALAFCTGCGKKSSTKPDTETEAGSDPLVNSADSVLAHVLFDEIGSNPRRPADLNFQTAYQYYDHAYQNPSLSAAGRVRARFGLAVLGLLILTSDPEVNEAFDEWKTYLQTHVPFEVTPSPQAPLGIPAGFTSGRDALSLPFDLVPLALVSLARSPLVAPDPRLSRVQAIIHDRALPRLTEAIAHLDAVAANAGFTFVVTPAMQGDLAAEPVEIDRTDILALRAACKLLSTMCRVAVAYDLDFPAYDEASLLAAIQPGSHWLQLNGDGAGQLGLAQLDLVGSVDDVSAAIGSLLAETDPQDDDVIRVGPRGLSQAGIDSLLARLPQIRQALTDGYTVTANWDGNPSTPEVPLTIRPGALFTNPVPDWKAMLPAYTGSTEHRPLSTQWMYDYVSADITIQADNAGTYWGGYSLSVSQGNVSEYTWGLPPVASAIGAAIQARYAAIAIRPDWGGDFYASGQFSGDLPVGLNSITVPLYESYSLADRTVAIPVITWVATQYSDWVWPDPTFRGLLPGLTTSSQFLTTFGISASQWQRSFALDWTQYHRFVPPPSSSAPALRRRGHVPLAASR